jgi:hypothetical protein
MAGSSITASLAFWIPDAVYHGLRGEQITGWDVLLLSLLLPASVSSFFFAFVARRVTPVATALASVLAIWVTGPWMIMVAKSGLRGFSLADALDAIPSFVFLFPVFTFMLSIYDGTLPALIVATIALPVIGHAVKERRAKSTRSDRSRTS